ncbi:hypothetical protein TSUD_337170 [Trifolium subterraneum]|uniref:Uncharacterized protein n=1 Tax=Trifolium subterraneum TaxID=3900 RepID=A0A2Z6NHC6_TRISU|nr:hypothetical protein TSUD_337170 [Trifolium subterraneum]
MKLTSKTISSPARTDKFPPPLMRFLRTNAGSRSSRRSRSAPYRSSSLASRFWSSPLRSEETESTSVDDDDNEKSSSQSMQRESISDKEDSVGERIGSDLENVEELLLKRRVKKEEEDEECAAVARPVVLTRCKSEPARVDYRIAPEVNINLWKKSRLGFGVTSSPLHVISD